MTLLKKIALSLTCLYSLFALPLQAQSDSQEKRLALVIGNSNYDKGSLKNPVNDALLIAQTLDSLDFDVILDTNITNRDNFIKTIREFGDKRSDYDVAFVYYAGHGVQVGTENFLLPTKVNFGSENDVLDYGVSVQNIMRYLTGMTNQVNVLVLDACRNNPFQSNWVTTRSLDRKGLAQIPPPNGSLIAFSTDAGQTAADGNDVNSIYTRSLASNLLKPNVEINQVFKNVRTDVLLETYNEQSPIENSKLTGGELYLNYQEDKLIVSLKEDLDFTWNMYDSLKLMINTRSDRGVVNIGDQEATLFAAKLFSSFTSLSERLISVDEYLYQSALFGILKTGMLASAYGQKNGTFSSIYHLQTSYKAALKLYQELENSDLILETSESRTQLKNEVGIAYLFYSNQSSDTIGVMSDLNLIEIINYFDESFESLNYKTKLLYLHMFQQLVITNKVDVEKLYFIVGSNYYDILNNTPNLRKSERSQLIIFCCYKYVEDKSKTIGIDKFGSYDSETGLFAVTEIRSKLVWVQNFAALLLSESFTKIIDQDNLKKKLQPEIATAINILSDYVDLIWLNSEEKDRLLSSKTTELPLFIDILTNQIAVLNLYAYFDSFELHRDKMSLDRFKLTEYKIDAFEAVKQFYKYPQYFNGSQITEYDYLILREKLNCYANSRALKMNNPDSYLGIRESSDEYLNDSYNWFEEKLSSTDRVDTLNEGIFTSYLYFIQRYVIWEVNSNQNIRGEYLKAARIISRLRWAPGIYINFYENTDVESFWFYASEHASNILDDSFYNQNKDSTILLESIELLQHYRSFYQIKYSGGGGSNAFYATMAILNILDMNPSGEDLGVLVSEWSELGRSFTQLAILRMKIGNGDYVSSINSNWNEILDFIESSSRLKYLKKEQTEMILSGFYNEVSQVQTFLSNDETQAFIQGRERLSSLIKTKF